MVGAINSALSGLNAASKRLEVSAANIANQNTTKTRVNGVDVNEPYVAKRVDQVSLSGGGIQVKVKDVNPPTTTVFDPEDPDANAEGEVRIPNVNLESEIVNQKIASYDYKANLKTIQIQNNLDDSLLDILS